MSATATDTSTQPDLSPAGDARALVGAAIFSSEPARLASFYGMLLGMRFECRNHPDGSQHRVADFGPVHVEIKALTQADGTPTPDAVHNGVPCSTIELSFEVPDAAASVEYALALGATDHQPIATYSWGDFGVVLDPDGNRLGLYSPPAENAPESTTEKEGA